MDLQEAWSYNRSGLELQLKMGGLTGGVVLPEGWPYQRGGLKLQIKMDGLTEEVVLRKEWSFKIVLLRGKSYRRGRLTGWVVL